MSADTGNRATLVHNIAFCLHALGEFVDAGEGLLRQSLEGFKNVNVPFSTKVIQGLLYPERLICEAIYGGLNHNRIQMTKERIFDCEFKRLPDLTQLDGWGRQEAAPDAFPTSRRIIITMASSSSHGASGAKQQRCPPTRAIVLPRAQHGPSYETLAGGNQPGGEEIRGLAGRLDKEFRTSVDAKFRIFDCEPPHWMPGRFAGPDGHWIQLPNQSPDNSNSRVEQQQTYSASGRNTVDFPAARRQSAAETGVRDISDSVQQPVVKSGRGAPRWLAAVPTPQTVEKPSVGRQAARAVAGSGGVSAEGGGWGAAKRPRRRRSRRRRVRSGLRTTWR